MQAGPLTGPPFIYRWYSRFILARLIKVKNSKSAVITVKEYRALGAFDLMGGKKKMCGIVGIAGNAPVAHRLVCALERLEYRGYDSAGIATLDAHNIKLCRAQGKIRNLVDKLEGAPISGLTGIGHTRWATHGAPTEANAHPHVTHHVAVVHNGIIENYRDLLLELAAAGYSPQSQTDTEVVALMVTQKMDAGATPQEAVVETLSLLRGAYALLFLFPNEDGYLIAARQGSPLAIGYGDTEMYLGSDALALSLFTRKVTYLEEGDWAIVEPHGAVIYDRAGRRVNRKVLTLAEEDEAIDKFPFRHFMAKEIHLQPTTIAHTLNQFIDQTTCRLRDLSPLPFDFAALPRLTISGCGTAYLAAAIARYWFEKYACLPVDTDIASEFRYRKPPLSPKGLALFISQSGETADTLAALRYAAAQGQHVASIVNVAQSTIARESGAIFQLHCGAEVGVASTKAFTSQLAILACLALHAGKARGVLEESDLRRHTASLALLPSILAETLKVNEVVASVAQTLVSAKTVIFMGRGAYYPLAHEGALKLKEISYIHAEGFAAGELKHGSIALIEKGTPVVVIAPSDELFEKTMSNMLEVAARGARVILITDHSGVALLDASDLTLITVPQVDPLIAPIVFALPLQLLAYHTAVGLGHDIDRPRNLAKSVTVE